MKIVAARALRFSIPLARPLPTARGPIGERTGFLIQLEGAGGAVGLGEAAPHPHDPRADPEEEGEVVRAALAALGDVDGARRWVEQASGAPGWILCGVDTALLDLVSRAQGRTMAQTLGALRRKVPVSALLDAADSLALREQARAASAAGFASAKRKGAADAAQTLMEAKTIIGASDLRLRIDANGSWSPETARAVCAGLPTSGIEWVEQPLAVGRVEELAALRQGCSVPMAVDEGVREVADVRALHAARACDAIVVKLVQVGGPTRAMRVLGEAASCGLTATVTTSIDTSIGTAAALAVAAAAPGTLAPCGLATGPLLTGDPMRGLDATQPEVAVPARPGLGLETDPAMWSRYVEAPL